MKSLTLPQWFWVTKHLSDNCRIKTTLQKWKYRCNSKMPTMLPAGKQNHLPSHPMFPPRAYPFLTQSPGPISNPIRQCKSLGPWYLWTSCSHIYFTLNPWFIFLQQSDILFQAWIYLFAQVLFLDTGPFFLLPVRCYKSKGKPTLQNIHLTVRKFYVIYTTYILCSINTYVTYQY